MTKHALPLVALLALCAGTALAQAPATVAQPTLEKGALLVATQQLDGTEYQHAVILITENSIKGAFGLAINHPTPVFIDEFLPDTSLRQSPASRLYMGGPNAMQLLFVVTRAPKTTHLNHLVDDLYFTAGRDAARLLSQAPAESRYVRAFSGYLRWAPGELDAAIAGGDWQVMPAKPEVLFSAEPEQVWEQVVGAWDGAWL